MLVYVGVLIAVVFTMLLSFRFCIIDCLSVVYQIQGPLPEIYMVKQRSANLCTSCILSPTNVFVFLYI